MICTGILRLRYHEVAQEPDQNKAEGMDRRVDTRISGHRRPFKASEGFANDVRFDMIWSGILTG